MPLESMPNSPELFRYYRELIATGHNRVTGGWEYDGSFYPDYLTVGGASYGAIRIAKQFCVGTGIDIGASSWPFPGAVPIDSSYGPGAVQLSDIPDSSQDYVFSSHTLEHIADWRAALREWFGKLKPGGTIFLYLPHPTCGLWRMENPFMARYHKWVPEPEIVKSAVEELGAKLIEWDDGPDIMYSFFISARKNI